MKLEKVLIVDPIKGEFTGDVEIEGKKITKVSVKDYYSYDNIVMPGFVDVHTHGQKGINVMDASSEDFKKWAENNFSYGVTSFIPSTVSASKDQILKVLENSKDVGLSIEGIHLEGPFISLEKKGAQNPQYIRKPTIEELEEIITEQVKLITMAPEVENFFDVIDYLKEKNVVISLGHTNADFNLFKKAFQSGINRITHFSNALTPLHHRNIGGTGSALYLDFHLEMICDGIHLSREFVDLTYQIKGSDKIILITDSFEGAALEDGHYKLGGLDVTVKDAKAFLADGTIASSTLVFNEGVKNFKKFTNCSLQELAKVSSYNALRNLNILNKGRIETGYVANLVILDKNLDLVQTIFEGRRVF
ncbi:MAG TPA: N-acetylglucosamine-6-phosphate deacetylase [Defluviitoga sp.]|nr:N-acetylglucosamine-6-phosphate deacetylase [Defluviitoga sp.]HOP24082.1 N-acetylglucosamine-6-phosphate deacetylase [Defluviitoga sp.]HPZ28584.1 N-acetylglucosamine-6-phosphate deacetylase [Defluviitoga sp.]HQD62378.1 N-acetylglucosamine-6-phosphate deacetylase [Defluviitoga sp.]